MTNITLSIDDTVYGLMKKHSEIKWSEFVRRIIEIRVKELESIEKLKSNVKDEELLFAMLASEEVLRKDWDNDLDERWNDL